MGNDPTNAVDPRGTDVIFLLDDHGSTVAFGQGHAAVLIGNDTSGWRYRSFIPKTFSFESASTLDGHFFREPLSKVSKEPQLQRYDKYMRFTCNAEKDKLASDAAQAYFGTEWRMWNHNCVDLVTATIHAAGVQGFQVESVRESVAFVEVSGMAGRKVGGKLGNLAGLMGGIFFVGTTAPTLITQYIDSPIKTWESRHNWDLAAEVAPWPPDGTSFK